MKPLWKISIATTPEASDAVGELLGTILICSASSYFDNAKQTAVVSAYLSEKRFLSRDVREEISSGMKRIADCGLNPGSCKIKIVKMRREDWAESWKRHFKPLEIGGALIIKPSWSKRRPRKNQAVVILDPGLSFGTGQHPTTEFCLREIVRFSKSKAAARSSHQSFLDIGTGSGILAIAAAKLGCKPVRAIDFDPEAVRVARSNAKANAVLGKMQILRGDAAKLSAKPRRQFDLVCANLVSDLLITERKRIAAQLKPGGILVLAGILKPEFQEVQNRFEKLGLKLISSWSEKEWRSGSLVCAREKKF